MGHAAPNGARVQRGNLGGSRSITTRSSTSKVMDRARALSRAAVAARISLPALAQ
eukprot:CAMPEP_0195538618 /NCGR_PEP_ID=MMETSP0794_2-20130614/49628_1 /TAXON_ID=515487 /ORGANISM="Stephanopyxis turris, Strain CCMP 815" /LENGTH=54 /DNA_ID=CAMNT_0040672617 /DNA_START=1357 /DNA_END=1521 /DNA_ORIENTATION=-